MIESGDPKTLKFGFMLLGDSPIEMPTTATPRVGQIELPSWTCEANCNADGFTTY